jgi:uncharacterized paraquat-inducible protein A
MRDVMAAEIKCSDCDCVIRYDGPEKVDDRLCTNCQHPLRGTHTFTSPGGVMVDYDRFPEDFNPTPRFH